MPCIEIVCVSELHKFLFDGLPVRGMVVRLTDSWVEILRRRASNSDTGAYPVPVRELLGEMTAAAVLMQFTDRQRSEILLRVATLEGIQPTALKDLNEVLFRVLAGGDKIRKSSLGGVKAAAEIINLLGTNTETVVLDSIRSYDPELAQKIVDKMFVFDDIGKKLDPVAIQTVLKEVASETLIVALKGAVPELREKFLSNMSSRAAEALREDLESRGPMRLSEVEAQQKEILKTVRRLSDEGQIVIGSGGDDAFV